jgi:hypothetical protein
LAVAPNNIQEECMKRIFIVGILVLFSCVSIFAQNWTVEPYINIANTVWDNLDVPTTISLSLKVGYYIAEDLNIGIYGSYSQPVNGYSFTIGPAVKYDFLKFERIYFSVFGNIYYSRYFGSYSYGNSYYDATLASIAVRPAVFFTISESIEVYWRFAELYYGITWIDNGHTRNAFDLSGPYGSPDFGLVFRF